MLLVLILAVFGNLGQLQMKYDHCKVEDFKGSYCEVPKKLHDLPEKVK